MIVMPLPPVAELSDDSAAVGEPTVRPKAKAKGKANPAAKPAAKPAAEKGNSTKDRAKPSLKRPAAKMKDDSKEMEPEPKDDERLPSLPLMKKPAAKTVKTDEPAMKRPATSRNAGQDDNEKLSVCAYMYKSGVWGIKVNKRERVRVAWLDLQFVWHVCDM